MICLIQINIKSLLLILMSVLMANVILGSSYGLYKNPEDNFYKSKRDYYYETEKSTENYRPSELVSLGLEANTKISNGNSHLNTGSHLDNQSGIINFKFPSFHDDIPKSCNGYFNCKLAFTTGWKDKTSIQVSTNNTNDKISKIIGQDVDVEPEARYELVIHMKLNQWARQSRVVLEGFNEISMRWDSIDQCPSANINGPQDWQEFTCGITIDANTTKVRPVLNAGWSSQPKMEATTWFDSIYLRKFRPFLTDPNLVAQVVYQGLNAPISMAFLGPNDFLVTGNNGTVHRIVNGVELSKQFLDLDVAGDGILGIAINKNIHTNQMSTQRGSTFVFLYFTAHKVDNEQIQEKGTMVNRLYRYEFLNNTLVNPKLLLELPAEYNHNGGPILIGPDKQTVYLSVGDAENKTFQVVASKALNNKTGSDPDGTGGILQITEEGDSVRKSILGTIYPTNLYYAYGIRQSFGMDFDPLTGKLWDTENGANWGDEINLVEPGFNSGWTKVQGIWKDHVSDDNFNASNVTYDPLDLVNFDAKGKYRSPEFVWKYTVGPTALIFVTSEKLGKEYKNDMLVGDVNNGRIYHFKLNQNRTGFLLEGALTDKIADSDKELENLVFAENFGIITDLKFGPDGYLYFVVYDEGKIYRIVPRIF
jgi:aldose sugar dehydrogenase